MTTAYLHMIWELKDCPDGKIPLFKGCGIYSDKIPTSRCDVIYTEMLQIQGSSYQDACNKMEEFLKTSHYHSWVLPWLSKNKF